MLVVDDQTSTVESNQAQPSLTFAFLFKCLIETDDDHEMSFRVYCMAKVNPISGTRYVCFDYLQLNFRHTLFFLFLIYFAGEHIPSSFLFDTFHLTVVLFVYTYLFVIENMNN